MGRAMGLEPTTPGATVQCSDQLSYARRHFIITELKTLQKVPIKHLVRPEGFEPPTHCLEGSCSILLSYGRMQILSFIMVGASGFEPPTPCSQGRCANRAALRPELPNAITRLSGLPEYLLRIEFFNILSHLFSELFESLLNLLVL